MKLFLALLTVIIIASIHGVLAQTACTTTGTCTSGNSATINGVTYCCPSGTTMNLNLPSCTCTGGATSTPTPTPTPTPAPSAAPVRSNGQPSASLPSTTTSVTMSLTTNINAACHYIDLPGAGFTNMLAMNGAGSTSHTVIISGLSSGYSKTYYIKCQAGYTGPINTDDYSITVTVQGTTPAPTPNPNPPNWAGVFSISSSLACDVTQCCCYTGNVETVIVSGN